MEISFSAPTDGLKTSVTRHDIGAHDVANINTPGFSQQVPQQVEKTPVGVRIGSISRTPNPDPARSNTDFAEEAVEMIENKNTLAANAKVIKVQDRMVGDLLDMVG
jgi:flagellar basal body rod protein FlgG